MPGTLVDTNIRQLLQRLEAEGLRHDSAETEHSRKMLNLEPATAEVVAILLRIAGTRNVLEIGTSNGYSTVWIAATIGPLGGRVTSIDKDPQKHALARENLAAVDLLRYVDLRLGAATEIAARLTSGRLIGLDRDAGALEIARQRLELYQERVVLVQADFSRIDEVVREMNLPLLNGILADLGVSSLQLDTAERGFCGRCGGNLFWKQAGRDAISITAGTIGIKYFSALRLGSLFP